MQQFLCNKNQPLVAGIRWFAEPDYSGFLGNRHPQSPSKGGFPHTDLPRRPP